MRKKNEGIVPEAEAGNEDENDVWVQGLIACGLKAGISKRELLEDYYIDEIGEVLSEYAKLLNPAEKDEEPEEVDGAGFFGF